MPLDLDALDQTDIERGGPGFDADEYVVFRRIEDAVTRSRALAASTIPNPDELSEDARVIDPVTYSLNRVRGMVTGWNLWKPPTADDVAAGRTKGAQIPFAPEQVEPVFRLLGDWLIDQVNRRSGATVPPIPEKVGPDGEKVTFPQDAGLDAPQGVADGVPAAGAGSAETGLPDS